MGDAEETGTQRPVRRWRTVSEKRRIAELTFEPGASVALVARAHGVNANQVFKWRRALKRGELNDSSAGATALLRVMVSGPCDAATSVDAKESATPSGAIHIEFPCKAFMSVESGADPVLLRSIIESLRK